MIGQPVHLLSAIECFNTPSKHFVGSRNPFLFVFVLIWHFNSNSLHFNSISSSQ